MWEPWESGYEVNRDPAYLEIILKELEEMGYWVVFVGSGFRSGPTVLLKVGKEELAFDLPRPWRKGLKTARVIYRDDRNIEYFFRVRILAEDLENKVIYTSKPEEIFRLERREYYRVSVPPGSKASFRYQDRLYQGEIKDISAGGTAVIITEKDQFVPGKIVEDIVLELKLTSVEDFGTIEIPKGEIRRLQDLSGNKTILGVKFIISDKIREEIIRYVIRREIEMKKSR